MNRTVLYEEHVKLNGNMIDFGGWEMPLNYEKGIIGEHLATRKSAGLFDISHMGRFLIDGKEKIDFLQYVLSNNVLALDEDQAQYTIIQNENGGALDDAYLSRFGEDEYILVVNAANREKDLSHLKSNMDSFDVEITDISDDVSMISLQGPDSKKMLSKLANTEFLTEPLRNSLNTIDICGVPVKLSKTGYTGEPLGYEMFIPSDRTAEIWRGLIDLGAVPVGLGARDTLRLEAGMPLYGHELGVRDSGEDIPVFSIPLAKLAVSFADAKGDYIGRDALKRQFDALKRIVNREFSDITDLPWKINTIAMLEKGIPRAGCRIYKGDRQIGTVTSGTMVPYYKSEGDGLAAEFTDESAKRAIGMALIDSDILPDEEIEVEIRDKKIAGVVTEYSLKSDAPPYARPIVYGYEEPTDPDISGSYDSKVRELITGSIENHRWRQDECINLIPSEQTSSRATGLLSILDPSYRYAEHKKMESLYDHDVFYYQGTEFINNVENLLRAEIKKFLNCREAETRTISGQMANTAVYSALMDYKNRVNKKVDPERLGYVLNNHIIRGGHLSAQPMGALHDYIAIDPKTEKSALVNFPVLKENNYKVDLAETEKILEEYRPEFIIMGKSMILHKEPVREIRKIVSDMNIDTIIMYDMAHVLGLAGPYFQEPFKEGVDIITGSTHKTFFGTQRGIIACDFSEDELKHDLWDRIEARAFPGSVSNHHLGTMLGLLMATYEMNEFKDEYQKNVISNAKYFAKALSENGLDVAGDPGISFTETHQVIVNVGYGHGPDIATHLENNNIIVNYQATPEEEGFTASGALRLGVSEMTRFGFGAEEFDLLAKIMAEAVIDKKDVGDEVKNLRSGYRKLKYCFDEEDIVKELEKIK